MLITGIDLAERHSAAVTLNEDGKVWYETVLDSGAKEKTPNPWPKAERMAYWWSEIRMATLDVHVSVEIEQGCYYVIEDIPPHNMTDPKPVLKLQGNLIGYMFLSGISEAHIITAHTWQNFFGYSKKAYGDSKKWATLMCERAGYVPGETIPKTGPEAVKILAKQKADLRDSYLLAEWLRSQILGLDSPPSL